MFSSISDYKKTINVIISTTLWSLLTIYMLAKIIFRIRVKELGKKSYLVLRCLKDSPISMWKGIELYSLLCLCDHFYMFLLMESSIEEMSFHGD